MDLGWDSVKMRLGNLRVKDSQGFQRVKRYNVKIPFKKIVIKIKFAQPHTFHNWKEDS